MILTRRTFLLFAPAVILTPKLLMPVKKFIWYGPEVIATGDMEMVPPGTYNVRLTDINFADVEKKILNVSFDIIDGYVSINDRMRI